MINLYLKIPKRFVRFIFKDGFCVLRVPFVCMIKFKLLAQFPGDHLSHPVVSSLILSLCIRLLYDLSFRLRLHVIFIGYFAAFCLFLHWLCDGYCIFVPRLHYPGKTFPYLGQDLCPFLVGPSQLLGLENPPIAYLTSGPHSSPWFPTF